MWSKADNNGTNIFVFGSNLRGYHGAGAALTALRDWGAVFGQAEGLQGQSYGIPTKVSLTRRMTFDVVSTYVKQFKDFAKANPQFVFLVTRIGCGYAGFTDQQIAPLFKDAPNNCVLPVEWTKLN